MCWCLSIIEVTVQLQICWTTLTLGQRTLPNTVALDTPASHVYISLRALHKFVLQNKSPFIFLAV